MQIKDSFTIQAPVETVWQFFMDFERAAWCVPGVQAFEVVNDKNFKGRLTVKVGPVAANFTGSAELTELEPPRRLVAKASADDKSTRSTVLATFIATLSDVPGGTEVAYEMDINLRGRLAQFGSAVFQSTTKKLTTQFVECLQTALTNGERA